MQYNILTLDNGLRVIHEPAESPVVYCGYVINAGSRDELPGEEGLAHFCEHTSFKGTSHRRASQLNNRLERIGGSMDAYTNKERTVYYATLLSEHIDRAVDVLSDMVFHSVYPQAEIDKEVEVICDEIESFNDSPADLIYDEFEDFLFQGHPLGHDILGTADKVRSYTTDDTLRFTHKYYRPDNMVFFASGNLKFSRLVRLLEKYTPKADGSILPKREPCVLPVTGHAVNHIKTVNKDTHQAHVIVGGRSFNALHPHLSVLFLLDNILGGPSMNSRLNLSLREQQGLVYTVGSSYNCYEDTGVWTAYFGCDATDVNQCLKLVHKELEKTMKRPLSEAQLAQAKRQLKGQMGIGRDNRENTSLALGREFMVRGSVRTLEQQYELIDAITSEDIRQVACQIFNPDNLYTLIYQ